MDCFAALAMTASGSNGAGGRAPHPQPFPARAGRGTRSSVSCGIRRRSSAALGGLQDLPVDRHAELLLEGRDILIDHALAQAALEAFGVCLQTGIGGLIGRRRIGSDLEDGPSFG